MTPSPDEDAVRAFDRWIRSRFVELNAGLEALYASQQNRMAVDGIGDELKSALVAEGEELIGSILAEAKITGRPNDQRFEVLGGVGFFMAACRRHEITEPSRERTSPLVNGSQLANLLGGGIGVVPRFTAVHNQTNNRAVDGVFRTFTASKDERLFVEYNTRSVLAYARAAEALVRIAPLGLSNPAALDLLMEAERALVDALALNRELSATLDIEEFYFSVRPYYKPYRVGSREYRGANAGDFAAFNQIDLILGLCSPTDPAYAQVALEKQPFLTPEDQTRLREAFLADSLLDQFMAAIDRAGEPWFQRSGVAFLRVCDALGRAAAHHHDDLVCRFLAGPSQAIPDEFLERITASGPPLPVLLRALENLRDQRLAADRRDIPTRHDDIVTLRSALERR